MFSNTVEYALRAIVFLADQQEESRTSQEIAEVTRVPQAYLSKVLHSLARAKLVKSQRGLKGGFILARPASELTIWDVVQAVDPIERIRECPLGLESHRLRLCPLHHRLDQALGMIEQTFRETTIAEVLAQPSTSKPLCNFPKSVPVKESK